ncbi:MAG: helix-turn-helix transcriptional regulator [Alphaproteobacteria bacterium]|nr:helix-turn-helix transcriptional regulator [Alphaproteobacteria bacterium]
MANIVFGAEYETLVAILAQWRTDAGLSQRELARRLGRSQSHVHRIEARQRRIEIVEFCRYARALGIEPIAAFATMASRLDNTGPVGR